MRRRFEPATAPADSLGRNTERSEQVRKPVESARMNRGNPGNEEFAKTVRRKRNHRLSDKLRAALAKAAALDRHDIAEQLMTLYWTTVAEDIRRTRNRRAAEYRSTTMEEPASLSQYPKVDSTER